MYTVVGVSFQKSFPPAYLPPFANPTYFHLLCEAKGVGTGPAGLIAIDGNELVVHIEEITVVKIDACVIMLVIMDS